MNKLKIIKSIVVIFTFLLVFGMLSALGVIYKKTHKQEPLQSINLTQPAGSYIDSFKIDGGRLFVLVKGGQKPDRIITIKTSDLSSLTINQERN